MATVQEKVILLYRQVNSVTPDKVKTLTSGCLASEWLYFTTKSDKTLDSSRTASPISIIERAIQKLEESIRGAS